MLKFRYSKERLRNKITNISQIKKKKEKRKEKKNALPMKSVLESFPTF